MQGVALDDEDKEPELGMLAAMVMGWWSELSAWRQFSEMGMPRSLTLQDVAKWQAFNGYAVGPWHLAQLRMIDDLFLAAYAGDER